MQSSVEKEKSDEQTMLTIIDHSMRIVHTRCLGQRIADVANTCRRVLVMTLRDFLHDTDITLERYNSRGMRIPGKSVPLRVSIYPGGALVTDRLLFAVVTDFLHKSVVTWANDEQERTVPKLKNVSVEAASLRGGKSTGMGPGDQEEPCSGRMLSSGSDSSVRAHAMPLPDDVTAGGDPGVGLLPAGKDITESEVEQLKENNKMPILMISLASPEWEPSYMGFNVGATGYDAMGEQSVRDMTRSLSGDFVDDLSADIRERIGNVAAGNVVKHEVYEQGIDLTAEDNEETLEYCMKMEKSVSGECYCMAQEDVTLYENQEFLFKVAGSVGEIDEVACKQTAEAMEGTVDGMTLSGHAWTIEGMDVTAGCGFDEMILMAGQLVEEQSDSSDSQPSRDQYPHSHSDMLMPMLLLLGLEMNISSRKNIQSTLCEMQ